MAHENDKCHCGTNRRVEFINLEYDCKDSERWMCYLCFVIKQESRVQPKNIFRNNQDVLKIIEKDLQNFKINRQSLLQHLHKLFNQCPISHNHKLQFAKEISLINEIFLDMINNPTSQQEQIQFDDILNSIRDIKRFYYLTELEIKRFLSIGRGHYQCDNSRFEGIINFMMKIDELKSSSLVLYLKLILNGSEYQLCYQKEINYLKMVTSLSISNNTLFCTTFLKDLSNYQELFLQYRCCIYATKDDNNHKNHFQLLLRYKSSLIQQSQSIISGYMLIIQLQSFPNRDNKTYILSTKSKKIIRSFKNIFSYIQYDQNNKQLIATESLFLAFYNINTLKLKNQIIVYQQLKQISFVSSLQKVISLIDKQLAVFDIDQENKCLINCQKLNYYDIKNYHINQQYNIIMLLYRNKIEILDFQLAQLKCIDWSGNYRIFTQISEDIKYLYSHVSERKKIEVFKLSLAN